ncbi:hypothetical protein A2U01_0051639, partial [Trifolium medium]|nr:hypothetical protein [Trifolium medium]
VLQVVAFSPMFPSLEFSCRPPRSMALFPTFGVVFEADSYCRVLFLAMVAVSLSGVFPAVVVVQFPAMLVSWWLISFGVSVVCAAAFGGSSYLMSAKPRLSSSSWWWWRFCLIVVVSSQWRLGCYRVQLVF